MKKILSSSKNNKKQTDPPKALLGLPSPPILEMNLQEDLEQNKAALKELFADCSDMVYRDVNVEEGRPAFLAYIEGIADANSIKDHMLRPIIIGLIREETEEDYEPIDLKRISLPQVSRASTWKEVSEALLSSSAVLLVDGSKEALSFNVKLGVRRGVEEPQTESVIRGPREGFTETLRVNTALLRFKIKTPSLKMAGMVIGKQTKTDIVLCYIEGLADEKIVQEARKRLKNIDIDGVLESGYIEELIEDNPYSPFPQMQYTERPDTVAAQLLEGRFAILIDGTPFALIAPVSLAQLLQASEDYYERFFIATLIRWLRYTFILIALFLPGLYIAVTTFHHDMVPTTLMLSIAAARESIPFPAIVEALMMEVSFEALREAGVRLPKTVGQAVSILGALVIGQAAVQAGIVSAPMVIVVSLTGIASFTIPKFNLAITVRMLRFTVMILAAVFGMFGIIIGVIWIAVHMVQLKSFGVPYLSGLTPYQPRSFKDILVRVPWWSMIDRPSWVDNDDRKRMKEGMTSSTKQPDEGW
ncbi:spore germination protein KA [Paenibacillus sediminis]|uniref:Spore germination protein KA n=2 Tax=Paenibacillus sediminis TaxID=664909 RepID=A0ABS4H2K2_9BACL|nr:spore germination protein KA [Paenibacillus sediminis]